MITDGTQAVMAAPGRGERFVHSNPPFFEGIFVCCPASGALARTVDQAALGQCRRSRPRAAGPSNSVARRPAAAESSWVREWVTSKCLEKLKIWFRLLTRGAWSV